MKPGIALVIAGSQQDVDSIRYDVLMRQHHAFGTSRCAARVVESRQVIIVHLLIDGLLHVRTPGHYILKVNHSSRRDVAAVDNAFKRRNGIAPGDHRCEGLIYDERLRLAVVENEDDFRASQANVERHNDRSHARAGIIQLKVAMAVEHQYGYAVSALHSKRSQAARKGVGTLVKHFPGVARLAAYHRLVGSSDFSGVFKPFSNMHGALLFG